MFADANSISNDSTQKADICIIGGGAAGISIALQFLHSKSNVIVVESGDFEFDAATQSLYSGTNTGVKNFPLDSSRLRFFGGTTNHWGGKCSVLDQLDFQNRDWIQHSGWPFGFESLSKYYKKAHYICGLGLFNYDSKYWAKGAEVPLITETITSTVFQFARNLRFGQIYKSDLRRSKAIRILLNSNAMKMTSDSNDSVISELQVTSLNGNTFKVRATVFILAMGGIENARFLLNNRHLGPLSENKIIGKYFMDHPHAHVGTVVLSREAFNRGIGTFYSKHGVPPIRKRRSTHEARLKTRSTRKARPTTRSIRKARPTTMHGSFTITPKTQQAEKMSNISFHFTSLDNIPQGVESVDRIWRSLSNREFPDKLGSNIKRILRNIDDVTDTKYRDHLLGNYQPTYLLHSMSEQTPNEKSCVSLSNEIDGLGLKRANLHWDLTSIDYHTLKRSVEILAHEFGRLGLGRVQTYLDSDPSEWILTGGWHHMGTTRIHESQKYGVVDANCLVHGMKNLYIAGSSVFPTCGHTNPTLTIVAMSLRLADYIQESILQ